MKKKICLSFAVICSMSLFATSALADGAAQTCGYDFQRSKDLKQKGDDRADKAKTLVQKMMADANTSLEDVGKTRGFVTDVKNYDKGMPVVLPALLKDPARCLVVIPSEKKFDVAPFFAGIEYGRGVEYCEHNKDGSLKLDSPSSYVQLEGASIGPKFGIGEETDLILSVSKDDVRNRKVNAAAELSVTPIIGRDAEAGIQSDGKSIKSAVAVSYSHTKGLLFAADFDFKTIAPDKDMIDAEAGRIAPERNPLMRLFHSSARKKADAACAQKDQVIASAQAAGAGNLEDATVASVLPSDAPPQLVAPVAVASAAIDGSKSLSPEAQASADTPAVVAPQAGATLDEQIRNAPMTPINSFDY